MTTLHKYKNIWVFIEKLIGRTFYIAQLCANQNSKCYIGLVNKGIKDLPLKVHYIIKCKIILKVPIAMY